MLARILDFTQPIMYGVLSWIDALTGYRPRLAEEEPDPIA